MFYCSMQKNLFQQQVGNSDARNSRRENHVLGFLIRVTVMAESIQFKLCTGLSQTRNDISHILFTNLPRTQRTYLLQN